jgi:hypothetical protein
MTHVELNEISISKETEDDHFFNAMESRRAVEEEKKDSGPLYSTSLAFTGVPVQEQSLPEVAAPPFEAKPGRHPIILAVSFVFTLGMIVWFILECLSVAGKVTLLFEESDGPVQHNFAVLLFVPIIVFYQLLRFPLLYRVTGERLQVVTALRTFSFPLKNCSEAVYEKAVFMAVGCTWMFFTDGLHGVKIMRKGSQTVYISPRRCGIFCKEFNKRLANVKQGFSGRTGTRM